MFKGFRFTVLVLLFLLCLSSIASATPTVLVDGKELENAQPILENGRTLVPLRAIFEALGAELDWDSAAKTITATKGSIEIKLIIGGKAYKNGQPITLEVPAKIVKGSTMVPLRFVSESFNAVTGWDKATQTITVTTSQKDLIITNEGFYYEPDDVSGRIDFFATVENPNDFYIPYRIPYTFSAYDFSGKVVATSGKGLPGSLISTIYVIPPHQKITITSYTYEKNIKPISAKLNIPKFAWKKIEQNVSSLPVKNVNLKKEDWGVDVLGEVTNTQDTTINIWIIVTLFDNNGNPVTAGSTAIDNIAPGQTYPFDLNVDGQPRYSSYSVIALPTRVKTLE